MLILSRLVGESILIGGNIEVKVLRIRGDCVRLAITAPKSINVVRTELIDKKTEGVADDRN